MLRASDIRQKEVINIFDGRRLGYVYDVEIDFYKGVVDAIVVPASGRVFGIFGRDDDYVIPWENIKKIGDDIILVDLDQQRRER